MPFVHNIEARKYNENTMTSIKIGNQRLYRLSLIYKYILIVAS